VAVSLRPSVLYLLLFLSAWTVLALGAAAGYKIGMEQSSMWWCAPIGVSTLFLAGGFALIAKNLQLRFWEAVFAAVVTIGIHAFAGFWILLFTACSFGDCL